MAWFSSLSTNSLFYIYSKIAYSSSSVSDGSRNLLCLSSSAFLLSSSIFCILCYSNSSISCYFLFSSSMICLCLSSSSNIAYLTNSSCRSFSSRSFYRYSSCIASRSNLSFSIAFIRARSTAISLMNVAIGLLSSSGIPRSTCVRSIFFFTKVFFNSIFDAMRSLCLLSSCYNFLYFESCILTKLRKLLDKAFARNSLWPSLSAICW